MKRYDKYKESGIPWLGEIPQHWEVKRTKEHFIRMSRPVRDEDEVITCFRDGEVTLRKNRRIDGYTESLKEIGYQGIRKGDLVIHQMDAFAGAIGVSDSDGKGTPVYICLQAKSTTDNYYYAYLLREMSRKGYIKALHRGIRERSSDFRYDTFSQLLIPLPPIEEQRAIASYLDRETERINSIIERLSQQKERYTLLKQSLISHVVTNGLPHHNPSTFHTLRLKDIGTISSGGVDKKINKGDPSVLMLNYLDIYKSKTYAIESNEGFMQVTATESQIATKDVLRGDVFFTPSSETIEDIGVSAVVLNDLPNTVYSYHIVRFRPHSHIKLLMVDFCKYLFNNEKVQAYMSMNAKGTTRKILNLNVIESLPISLPTLSEQAEIVAYLDERCGKIDKMVEAIGRKVELLEQLKRSLIEEVVTGQRKVVD